MTVTIITEGDPPKVETVGYDEVPLSVVKQFAEDGDPDAAAWLAEHPEGLAANREAFEWNEEDHPRDEKGRFGPGDGGGGAAGDEPVADAQTIQEIAQGDAIQSIVKEGTPDGTGTPEDPVYVDGDMDAAVQAMVEGKSIRLDEEKQASVLVEKLGDYAKVLRDKGEEAPPFNLCSVSAGGTNLFCGENLGITRFQMPQLKTTAVDGSPAAALRKDPNNSNEEVDGAATFTAVLEASGVNIYDRQVPVSMLRASQNELNGGKVGGIMRAMEAGTLPPGPIWITKDGYVLDGHHRWAAALATDLNDGHAGDIKIDVREVDMEIGAGIDYARAFGKDFGLKQADVNQVRRDRDRAAVVREQLIQAASRLVGISDGDVRWLREQFVTETFYREDQARGQPGNAGQFVEEGGGGDSGSEREMAQAEIVGVGNVKEFLDKNPPNEGEKIFEYQSRITSSLPPDAKHELLFHVRERYAPVPFVSQAASDWRAAHGLPDPQVDVSGIAAPRAKAEIVAEHFERTADQSNDPEVRAAYTDFKRENAEMFDYMTRPQDKGGMGMKVDFSPFEKGDPYPSATAQANDVRENRHLTIQSGLGGNHSLMSVPEYDTFRAVHDTFGHTGTGAGFDRHGEYQTYLEHRSMYTGPAARAMATEYHGSNCVTPDTLILTADLTWVRAGDLHLDDELVGFDEQLSGHGRGHSAHLRHAVVEACGRKVLPCYRVVTDRGELTVSAEHPFVAIHRWDNVREWREAQLLRVGDKLAWTAKPWTPLTNYDAGYLAGIFDGEGSLDRGQLRDGNRNGSARMSFGQNPGIVLDESLAALKRLGFEVIVRFPTPAVRAPAKAFAHSDRLYENRNVKVVIQGGRWETMRALGQLRPPRLLAASRCLWEGGDLAKRGPTVEHGSSHAQVLSVEFVGDQECVTLQTSTRTFIAEGLPSHNTALWSGAPGTPGTGKSILLPESLIPDPWDKDGKLVKASTKGETFAAAPEPIEVSAGVKALATGLGLGDTFAAEFDRLPWHFATSETALTPPPPLRAAGATFYREDQARDHGRFVEEGAGGVVADKDRAFDLIQVGMDMGEYRTQHAKADIAGAISRDMKSSTEDLTRAAARETGWVGQVDRYFYRVPETGRIMSVKAGQADVNEKGQLVSPGDFGDAPYVLSSDFAKADDPAADPMIREQAVDRLIASWAMTANDQDAKALAIQESAVEEFGIKGAAGWDVRFDGIDEREDVNRPVYRDFLRTQYDDTQARLKDARISAVELHRGFTWDGRDPPAWAATRGVADIPLRPLSSWTSAPEIAKAFAGGDRPIASRGPTVRATVPAERILSFPRTGFGSIEESEFVVIGGPIEVEVSPARQRDEE